MIKFDIITIFPKIFDCYFSESILGRAQKKKLIKIKAHDLRRFTNNEHKTVDDKPYGGGPGMVLKVEPIYRAVEYIKNKKEKIKNTNKKFKNIKGKERVILFSAKGKTMTQADVRRWAKHDQIIMICGRYEGVDERVAKYIADEEVSVGNYVLTGGEIPAMIVVDAVSRLVLGVLGKEESLKEESFGAANRIAPIANRGEQAISDKRLVISYLEYPQYTRPEEFMGWRVPKILLSGNHQKIKEWRERKSQRYTK